MRLVAMAISTALDPIRQIAGRRGPARLIGPVSQSAWRCPAAGQSDVQWRLADVLLSREPLPNRRNGPRYPMGSREKVTQYKYSGCAGQIGLRMSRSMYARNNNV